MDYDAFEKMINQLESKYQEFINKGMLWICFVWFRKKEDDKIETDKCRLLMELTATEFFILVGGGEL